MPSQEMVSFVALADKAADNALEVIEDLREQLRAATASKEILLGRIAKADSATSVAVQEMSAYARRCGELEAQLCAQLVEHPGRKAMLLVLEELRRAKLKHPNLAINEEEALVVLASEHGELATAILRRDIHGEHGVSARPPRSRPWPSGSSR